MQTSISNNNDLQEDLNQYVNNSNCNNANKNVSISLNHKINSSQLDSKSLMYELMSYAQQLKTSIIAKNNNGNTSGGNNISLFIVV
jgi:hypothetical protein